MNIEQHAALQGRIVETQRLALHLAEEGHSDASRALLQAITRMQRIKPTKPVLEEGRVSPLTEAQWNEAPTVGNKPVKGKGA